MCERNNNNKNLFHTSQCQQKSRSKSNATSYPFNVQIFIRTVSFLFKAYFHKYWQQTTQKHAKMETADSFTKN